MTSRRLLIVAAWMVAAGGFLRVVSAADLAPEASGLRALPLQIDDWRGHDLGRFDRDTEAVLQADDYLLRRYARDGVPVDLFVAYYATQRSGHTIHSPLNCLPGTGWEWVDRRRERISVGPGRGAESRLLLVPEPPPRDRERVSQQAAARSRRIDASPERRRAGPCHGAGFPAHGALSRPHRLHSRVVSDTRASSSGVNACAAGLSQS